MHKVINKLYAPNKHKNDNKFATLGNTLYNLMWQTNRLLDAVVDVVD